MASDIPNRGPELLGVDAAFVAMAIVANALRCFVRVRMVKAFGVDDWLMAIATLSFIGYSTSSILGVHYGTGRHHRDLEPINVQKGSNCWWFCYLFYCTTMITSKISIGFFLLRISVRKLHSWIIYAAMFISVVAGIVFFFVTLFQCHPIRYFWTRYNGASGTCINVEVIVGLAYLYSVFSIISDFTFAIIPAFLVWNLQLKRRTKIALLPLLTMGCVASSAVVARLPYLVRLRNPDDFLWETLDVAIWSTVEQGLAITAGSLATLRPLFNLAAHRLGLTTAPSRLRPSGYGGYGGASPAASRVLESRRKQSQSELNTFKLSTHVEARGSDEIKQEEVDVTIKSPSWYQTGFHKSRRNSSVAMKKLTGDSESEKSLHGRSSKESLDNDGMAIMVQKSFFVTDERS